MRHLFLLIGFLYSKGYGVAQNYVEARKWVLKAAEQGHAGAQYSLGLFFYQGQGVAQDYVETRKWWLKAAEQGDAVAQKLSKEYFNRDVAAQTQTTYEDVVAGMKCTQSLSGHLECDYRVGRSLHFTIVAPGQPGGSIYFYSASI